MPALAYDLNDPQQRKTLQTTIQRWIDEDKAVAGKYWNEWNEIDQRLNTDYKPVGWTNTFSENLATKNNPTQSKEVIREFVQVPRIRPNHESKFGDFLATRRRLQITGRTPAGRNRAKVLHAMVEYIEDSSMIPETIYAPSMDNAISKGLHWIKLGYNHKANGLKGRFEPVEINLRDVFVDSRTRGWNFKSMNHVIQKQQFLLTEAKKKFRKYPIFNSQSLGSDREYDEPYANTENTNDDVCTIYEVQWKETFGRFYRLSEDQNDVTEISEDDFLALQQDPATQDQVFDEEEEKYFVCLYNSTIGPFFVMENPFKMWTLIPMGNIYTDQRLYPLGDVWIYKNLQDLLDVLVTVFLDNAKGSNIPIATSKLNPEALAEYQDSINQALRKGGLAIGIDNIHYRQPINAALATLVPWVIGWIQDSASRHGASMGELPARQIAKETVQTLIAKDRQSHGRMDLNVKYTLTQFAKLMVSYISAFCTEPDFIDVSDAKPNSPSHIPVNQRWTEDEYLANLADMYGIPVPSTPQEEQQFNQKLQRFKADFERDNDVKPYQDKGFTIDNRTFSKEEIADMFKKSGMTKEEFTRKYAPVPATVKMVEVNTLHAEDPDLNVVYEIDNDYQNDPEFRANRALMLNARGAMTPLDMMREMDVPDAERIARDADERNQVMGLAKTLVSDPQLMNAVQNLIAQREGAQQ